VSQPNYKAVMLSLIKELRLSLQRASFSHGEPNMKEMENAIDIISKIELQFDTFLQNLGSVDFTDRRYALALELMRDFHTKTSILKNMISAGKTLLALNKGLPEFETSLNTVMDSLILVARGAPMSAVATFAPQAQAVPTTIPPTLQLSNPIAGQVYAYLSRVGQADTETIARELGLSLDTVIGAINNLVANNYVTTELSPEKKVVAKLVKRESE